MTPTRRTRPAPGLIVAAVFVVAVLLLLALAAGTGTDIRAALQAAVDSFFPPAAATVQAQQIRDLYNVVFLFAAAIFVAVEALIVWTVIRYRRKPGDDELPAQTHGNNLAETLWTIIPTVIVAFLFFISWQTLNTVEAVSEQPGLQVRAVAGQFQWSFEYLADDGETVEYTQFLPTGANGGMAVPVGQPIRLYLAAPADDVIHAFYVPRFLFKRDVVPGRETMFEFQINEAEAGQTFRGQCAELCGTGHRIMTFEVHALAAADFDTWLETAKASAPPQGEPGASAPPPAATLEVSAQGLQFEQDALEAPADAPFAIHFVNNDAGIDHDVAVVRSDGSLHFNGEDIKDGETTYQVPPLAAGEHKFICTLHSNMTGTLTVK